MNQQQLRKITLPSRDFSIADFACFNFCTIMCDCIHFDIVCTLYAVMFKVGDFKRIPIE